MTWETNLGHNKLRTPAWLEAGIPLDKNATATEALDAMGRYEAELVPLRADTSNHDGIFENSLPIEDKYAVVRRCIRPPAFREPDPTSVVGVVGERYTVVQDRDLAFFAQDLIDTSDATFEAGGSLRGGRTTYFVLGLPQEVNIGGEDPLQQKLIVMNAHDGTSALRAWFTAIRMWCTNQLNYTFRTAAHRVSIRHTTSATTRLQQARETLGIGWNYLNELTQTAEVLVQQPMTDDQWAQFVEQIFPMPPEEAGPRAHTMATNRRERLVPLWYEPTNDNIRGTRWGALQAVTEYVDWHRPVRGGDDIRATRQMEESGLATKDRALALLTA